MSAISHSSIIFKQFFQPLKIKKYNGGKETSQNNCYNNTLIIIITTTITIINYFNYNFCYSLFCSRKTPPGVLHPGLGSLGQDGFGIVGINKKTKIIQYVLKTEKEESIISTFLLKQ